MAILDDVKMACRVSTNMLDAEYTRLINAALLDLGVAGVETETMDELVIEAICTYCKMRSGIPEDYAELKAAYDEMKSQMSNASGYTDWEVSHV